MKPRLKSTEAARDLIKRYEPFLPVAERGADGRYVVGYGHRASAREGVTVDAANADLLLIYDVLQAERAIDETLATELGAPQRDALVSFALGVGLGAFRQSATVRLIVKHRWRDAAEAIAAWGGGQSPRRAAERELFLTDLPDDADQRPVELVIEFEHADSEPDLFDADHAQSAADAPAEPVSPPAEPDDEAAGAVALTAGEPAELDTLLDAGEEEIAEPAEADAEVAEPEDPVVDADEAGQTEQDSVTARVIARMREQIAPRRSVTESTSHELAQDVGLGRTPAGDDDGVLAASFDPVLLPEDMAEANDAAEDVPAGPSARDDVKSGKAVGFVFAASDAAPDQTGAALDEASDPADDASDALVENAEDDTPSDGVANDTDIPPMTSGDRPAQSAGATGEAGGLDAANDPAETLQEPEEDHHPAHAEDLPDPHEIDPGIAGLPEDRPLSHWQNGDSSAVPAPASGRWGTIAVFTVGLFVMLAGIVDTMTKWTYYWESKSLLFGPAAAIVGGILFAGAAIMLIGRLFGPKEVERKTGPLP